MAAIAPSGGGRGNGHIPPDDKGRDKKRKADGHDPTVDASHHADKKDKKAPELPTLSQAHQEYVTSLVTEIHKTATESYTMTRAINLTGFILSKKDEVRQKKEEKLSAIAAIRFLHTNGELKEKAIQGFKILDYASWVALRAGVSAIYDPLHDKGIEEEVGLLCDHDPIAKNWDRQTIMKCIKEKDPKGLIQHTLPEAELS